MSEADWWVCVRCQSLNSLSARKCYSCHTSKPKVVARASEVLGYRVRESWDGKVQLQQLEPAYFEPPAPPPELPPLRDPIPRRVVVVAPPPPHGARITYRQTIPGPHEPRLRQPMPPPPPAVPVVPPVPDASQAPPAAPAPTVPPPARADALPMPAAPPPPMPAAPLPNAASLPPPPARPPLVSTAPAWIVAADERQRTVGMGAGAHGADDLASTGGEGPTVPGQTQEWPHWRALLDGPVPDGERLRATLDEPEEGSVPASSGSLSRAIGVARAARSGAEPQGSRSDRASPSPAAEAGRPAEDGAAVS